MWKSACRDARKYTQDGTDLAFPRADQHHEPSLRELPGTAVTQCILHLIQMARRKKRQGNHDGATVYICDLKGTLILMLRLALRIHQWNGTRKGSNLTRTRPEGLSYFLNRRRTDNDNLYRHTTASLPSVAFEIYLRLAMSPMTST